MNIIYKFSILSSFLGLWITSLLPEAFELILGFILIFTFGMVHGSNDIMIVDKLSKKTNSSFFKILLTYLFVVTAAIIIFYYIPVLALALFILFSAYHFGEQHWEEVLSNLSLPLQKFFFFCYGLLILYLVFLFNVEAVINIIYEITSLEVNDIYASEVTQILFVILFLITAHAVYKKQIAINSVFRELFSLLVFAIIFNSSSLIWGFTIYFIFWHSIPSLLDQITFIYGDLKKKSVLKYIKAALPYWLVSLVGITLLFLIFKDEKHFHSLFFAFIAAVTFPHAVVMLRMFSNKRI
jgi:Brp/Blh family beta-carotene 15,15'-monooxygenase